MSETRKNMMEYALSKGSDVGNYNKPGANWSTARDGVVESVGRGKKRKRNEAEWKCNVRKRKLQAGEEYESKNGKIVEERQLKPPCSTSCKKKCSEKFSEEERFAMFTNFWNAKNDVNFKRQFIACTILKVPVSKRTVPENESKRNSTLSYFLERNGIRVPVCKTFYLNTLSISESFVKVALEKKGDCGIVSPDQRGRKTPPNKLSDEVRENIRQHIKSFPTVQSQRSRKNASQRRYLESHLNLGKMYSLYVERCQSKNLDAKLIAKKWLYYDIFNHEFNLSFEVEFKTASSCN